MSTYNNKLYDRDFDKRQTRYGLRYLQSTVTRMTSVKIKRGRDCSELLKAVRLGTNV
jgi:hypothetical protein